MVIFLNGCPLCLLSSCCDALVVMQTLWISSTMVAHFAFVFLVVMLLLWCWHYDHLLQWLLTLFSVFLLCCSWYDASIVTIFFKGCPFCFLFSCCDASIMTIFSNGCPLCFLFSCCDALVVMLALWLSSSMVAHVAFCFLFLCCSCCDASIMTIFFNSWPFSFLFYYYLYFFMFEAVSEHKGEGSREWNWCNITKTRLYNFDLLKPHFYMVKMGFTGVYIIFLIVIKSIYCGTH